MQTHFFKIFPIFLICNIFHAHAETRKYVCTPENVQTQISFQGKLFALNISDKCLFLQSIERKNATWSWRIHTSNSLGDVEGVRSTNCNDPISSSVGDPAVWQESKRTMHIFSLGLQQATFKCETAP